MREVALRDFKDKFYYFGAKESGFLLRLVNFNEKTDRKEAVRWRGGGN